MSHTELNGKGEQLGRATGPAVYRPAEEKLIVYFVNGEKQTTHEDELKVGTILKDAKFTPVTEYELERDRDHKVFKNPDEVIPVQEGERFTAIFVGPTPTS